MNRSYILGIAISMVIIYHLFCWVYNPIGRLNIGYVGVDIFLFFSGLGLSYSYKKNNLKDFYKRRFRKIYPLYFIVSIMTIAIIAVRSVPSIHNFIINTLLQITTLSYYINPESSIDWYLNSLFLFYLLFPLLFKFSIKYKLKFYFFLIVLCIVIEFSAFILFDYSFYWMHKCFIERVPIFCLGIIYSTTNYSNDNIVKFTKWGLVLFFVFNIISLSTSLHFFSFLSISFIAPLLILICNRLSKKFQSTKLEYLGNYTLELYCANLIVWRVLPFFDSIILKFLLFFVIQIVISILFIYINNWIKKIYPIGVRI